MTTANDTSNINKFLNRLLGVQLEATALRTLETIGAGFKFVSVDLRALTVRIKHMSAIDYATAKVLSQEAYQGGVGIAGDRLLSLAKRQFNRTLQSDPLNKTCKSEATITRLRILARKFENRASRKGVDMMRKARYYLLSDQKLLAACTFAQGAGKETTDSDDLANMIRAILSTWAARRRGKQADLFSRCGGASHVEHVFKVIKFVTDLSKDRLLTLELCTFLATCKDEQLLAYFHHFIDKIATTEAKDIESQGIPLMEVSPHL